MGVTFYKYGDDGTLQSKQVTSDYNAKVYPMVCDRLTLTCDIPPGLQSQYINYFKQENLKPFNGYMLSGPIKNLKMETSPYLPDMEDKITSAYIQCNPSMPNVGFLRIDFNPAKLDIVELKGIVNNNYLIHPDYGFDYVLTHGRVSRIDFAVDIASEVVDDLYYYYEKMRRIEVIRTYSGQTEYIQGQTEYIGGKISAAKRIAIYDRIPAIKYYNNQKKWNKNLQMPLPDYDVMRVEIRLFPKKKKNEKYHTLSDILSFANPFAPLLVASPRFDKYDDTLWKFFIALARFEGAQAALARLPKQDKKKFVGRLKDSKVAWWQPEKLWEQLPTVIQSITDS